MRYRDIIEGSIVPFPQQMPTALSSFTDFMTDSRPVHMLYQKGDVLSLGNENGEVVRTTDDRLVIRFPSGDRIVKRNDPRLMVAPYADWKLTEAVDINISSGHDTVEYLESFDPGFFRKKREIKYYYPGERDEMQITATQDGKIAGMAGMQINPYDPEQLWIKFVTVLPAFQNQKIGSVLLRQIFLYANQHGLKVAPGSFTEEGERLRHLHDRFEKEFPATAYARNERGDWINDRGQIVRSMERR